MSKATRQSLTLLATIGGCLFEMKRGKMFSVVVMQELVWETYTDVLVIMEKWPDTGDDNKNKTWILTRIEKWRQLLDDKDEFYLTTLAAVCDRCLTDLRTVVKNPTNLQMLDRLVEPINRIHSFSDPKGVNFPAYEHAGNLMEKLYDLIDWEW